MTSKKKELFVDLNTIDPKEVEWLWEPFIPFSMITIMEGDPGVGKSFLAMQLAAQISIGGELPEGQKLDRGRVLYLSAEDDAAYTIRPRIDAMGGDPTRIRVQGDFLSLDEKGLNALMREVRRKPPDLLILDPLFAYVPSGQDMYKPNVIRQLLSFLKDIAETGETAVLIVRHLTKAKHDKAIYRGGGSMDVIGAARSAFLVCEHPNDSSTKLVVHIKHNIAKRGQTQSYEIYAEDGGMATLNWLGPSDITIDDLISSEGGTPKMSALDEAIQFLRVFLKNGPEPTTKVEKEAAARDISEKTLERARRSLGVVSKKKGKSWVLSLPDEE
ncbi:AAA family ATPase [Maritimibacter sp. HL-12]|uniref:AAA family ATPase n=1 Tax=Maritimibacter sp. HL-12 TaxID=1162418 RepID=UPI000A0F1FEE|nr:AAA family ATPase [Maritimibacter sp. HL-12]SMH39189.1 Predicted ATP-dependent serine protease [Maritimibacter sp. HL-12]